MSDIPSPTVSPAPNGPSTILVHAAQFVHGNIAEEPALFTNPDEMQSWISKQLNVGMRPLFPRPEEETESEHVRRLLQLQDEFVTDNVDASEEDWRHGAWDAEEDYLNIWELNLRLP